MTQSRQKAEVPDMPTMHDTPQVDVCYLGPPSEVIQASVEAEASGCNALWTAETEHDAFLLSALALSQTTTLHVGTGIVLGLARSPMTIAQEAVDLQDLSHGRFHLGIGSQVRAHITKRFSMPWVRPVAQMRELVEAIRAIFAHWYAREPLDYRGEFYQLTFNSDARQRLPAHGEPPPIILAAVGPRMLRLTADVAEGFISHTFLTEQYLREVIAPILSSGRAGAQPGFQRAISVLAVVDDGSPDAERRLHDARADVAFHGSTPAYRPVLDLHGLGGLHEQLHRLSREDRWDDMTRLIDDDVLELFVVHGKPDRVGREIARRYGDIATRVRLPFHALDAVPHFATALPRQYAPMETDA